MKTMIGLVNLEHEQNFFHELTYFRGGASVPFAGRYRLIDFPLSNMGNSFIEEVAVFTSVKFRSLMDHLGTGENWGLGRQKNGLFILPPDWNDPTDISKGDLRFFHNNRDYFARGNSDYVLISGSQFVSNTNYLKAFDYHIERGADVTLISTHVDEFKAEHECCLRIVADEDGWVKELTHDKQNPELFTSVYIINKDVLMNLVDDCIAHHQDNFFVNGIKDRLNDLKVQTYWNEGYGEFVNTIESYYRHNMNLLDSKNYQDLFYNLPYVRTKIGNQPPTKYRENVNVTHSLVANGCTIDGDVTNSVLFRDVQIAEGAVIKNSIIMQRCKIDAGVYLENVIIDKDVHVTEKQKLMGSKEKPYVIAKRQVI